jgi:DNA ligase-associated metallophosphoesterase
MHSTHQLRNETPGKIETKISAQQATPFRYAGQIWIADASGGLFWPKHKILIVSDCHFEKGSFLKQFANPIPTYDTITTISHIAELMICYEPEHIICLGDSFHDLNAGQRMLTKDIFALQGLIAQAPQWTWILGNHDPDIPWQFGGARQHHLVLDDIMLAHEPESPEVLHAAGAQFQIIGHFHPKMSVTIKRHSMYGKCFVHDEVTLIMPGIGAFTGGLDVHEAALDRVVVKSSRKYVLTYQNKIYAL